MKRLHYQILIIIEFIIILILAQRLNKRLQHDYAHGKQFKGEPVLWNPPDTSEIPAGKAGRPVYYGRELIMHTARYFGPKGNISRTANGMNCQNCHLAAGTKPFSNNFSLVAASYPKYHPRRGGYVSIAERVNGCMERSINGDPIDTTGKEMKAIIAYFKWLGKGVDRKAKLLGIGTEKLPLLERAADPVKGEIVFTTLCQACHGKNGEGKGYVDSTEYQFPPLWGPRSYNTGAGLYRISEFAAYVKNNMPFGITYLYPLLTDEQAWDVAAFVNSQPRPTFKEIRKDWPNIGDKPFDYPFGPYADTFSERQHKYGPFKLMRKNSRE